MTRPKVLLISKKVNHVEKLHERLIDLGKYEVKYEEKAETAMALVLRGDLSTIIFNLEYFGPIQEKLIQDIKEVSKATQIVALAGTVEVECVQRVKNLEGLVVIDKSNLDLDTDLIGLCERLIGAEKLYFRENVRKQTNQAIKVELVEIKRTYDGLMKDITEKGACVEIRAGRPHIHDKVKIIINLPKLNRQRIISGEVRWVNLSPGRVIFGVSFIGE